jgi:hypothetical protein
MELENFSPELEFFFYVLAASVAYLMYLILDNLLVVALVVSVIKSVGDYLNELIKSAVFGFLILFGK